MVGLLSVALASDYVIAPWADARLSLGSLTILLRLMIIGLGLFIARQITQPLQDLVSTAEAVSVGDLERRSKVHARDELGVLARSFNSMTGQAIFGRARVELFVANNGQGQRYLGALSANPDGSFNGTLTVIGLSPGMFIVATATDTTNNSSEFGPTVQIP